MTYWLIWETTPGSPNCNRRCGSDRKSSGHAAANDTANSGQARCNTGCAQPTDSARCCNCTDGPRYTRSCTNRSRLYRILVDVTHVIPLHTDR